MAINRIQFYEFNYSNDELHIAYEGKICDKNAFINELTALVSKYEIKKGN